jgi:radical SAM superfamily enzyme YgiQ (UPF0313 family)
MRDMILLLNAPVWQETGFRSSYNPGMGLLYIGAMLRKNGHRVMIYDCEAMGIGVDEIIRELEVLNVGYVGIGCLSNGVSSAVRIGQAIKERFPEIWVAAGGAGPSAQPELFDLAVFDSVCIGEGELIIEKVFSERGIHKGIPAENLDDLPDPAYDLLHPMIGSPLWSGNLPKPPVDGKIVETVVMWSRGCPHPCVFCLPSGTKILTSDITWKNIESVGKGDVVVGVGDGEYNLKYVPSVVKETFHRTSKILKITTEEGIVYSTPEHPWLTTHNRWIEASKLKTGWSLRKLSTPCAPPEEDMDYKVGYISGATKGDGHIGHRKFGNRKQYTSHRFSLVGDSEMTNTVLKYFGDMKEFENVHRAKFDGGMYKHITFMACAYTRDTVNRIEKLVEAEIDSDEYRKGFMAGFFDAEGSYSGSSLRVSNLDKTLLDRFCKYARQYDFDFAYEEKGVRLNGGVRECVRFISSTNPKVVKKKTNLFKMHVKNETKILSVEDAGGECDVYNLETTSGNFVADGFITHNCSKASIARGQPRRRSPGRIVEELKMLRKKYGVNSIFVYDDELIGMGTEHEKWLFDVLEGVVAWNNDEHFNPLIWFKGQGRCSEKFITEETGLMLKDAGFFAMMMGCESGSEKVKKRIKKGTSNQDIRHSLKILSKWVDIYGFWMVGMPEETEAEVNETIALVSELTKYMRWFQVTIFSPLPGSTFWKEAITKDWIDSSFLSSRNFQVDASLNMPWMTKHKIVKMRDKIRMAYESGRGYDKV